MPAPPRPARRTQAERTATMRQRLMDAAVECLEERGYAGFAISDVVARAGVTKGALFHHFATGTELVAEAVWWKRKAMWLEEREDLLAAIAAGTSLEGQLRISWKHLRQRANLEIEYTTAIRADKGLAKAKDAVEARYADVEPRYNTTPVAWATVPGDPTPTMSRYLVGYFLTGMQTLLPFNAPELPEEALGKFARVLELGLAAYGAENGAGSKDE